MKTRTVCLPPGQLTPGMTLAAPILGTGDKVLLAAGVVLDEATLGQLRQRGIAFASVSIADSRDPETIAQDLAKVEERVNYIFRGAGSASRNALRERILDYRRKLMA